MQSATVGYSARLRRDALDFQRSGAASVERNGASINHRHQRAAGSKSPMQRSNPRRNHLMGSDDLAFWDTTERPLRCLMRATVFVDMESCPCCAMLTTRFGWGRQRRTRSPAHEEPSFGALARSEVRWADPCRHFEAAES